jgi:hypothetical protein
VRAANLGSHEHLLPNDIVFAQAAIVAFDGSLLASRQAPARLVLACRLTTSFFRPLFFIFVAAKTSQFRNLMSMKFSRHLTIPGDNDVMPCGNRMPLCSVSCACSAVLLPHLFDSSQQHPPCARHATGRQSLHDTVGGHQPHFWQEGWHCSLPPTLHPLQSCCISRAFRAPKASSSLKPGKRYCNPRSSFLYPQTNRTVHFSNHRAPLFPTRTPYRSSFAC